eukprot:1072215-Heterocapsa_arctica.AAC.1
MFQRNIDKKENNDLNQEESNKASQKKDKNRSSTDEGNNDHHELAVKKQKTIKTIIADRNQDLGTIAI